MDQAIREVLDDVAKLSVPAASLSPEADLFAAGLTSFATVNIMLAIEERFDIEFPDSLLRRDTFRSIASLRRVVESLNPPEPA